MSEITPDNQPLELNNNEFDDDDDLWEMQSEKSVKPNVSLEQEEEISAEDVLNQEEIEQEENLNQEDIPLLSLEDLEPDEEELEQEKEKNLPIKIKINSTENKDKLEVVKIVENIAKNQELIREQQDIEDNKKIREAINLLVEEGLKDLQKKKEDLELSIAKLEKRKAKIEQEMKTTFAGVSQDLAIRVQGFKDYLVGSLQDLAAAAEQLELVNNNPPVWENNPPPSPSSKNSNPQFIEKNFKEETRQIRALLDQYRTRPDYYGSPWQLRRTFEPIHAERVSDWFFKQGGRGSLRSMGSRLQNILIASAIISILYQLYDDRVRVLILADSPERLGEWRRGLQDCLGISRSDFGPNRGIVLFETPDALIQKGDRIVEEEDLPLVIMDQTDDKVSLSLLKFPLWLAFAPEQINSQSSNYYY